MNGQGSEVIFLKNTVQYIKISDSFDFFLETQVKNKRNKKAPPHSLCTILDFFINHNKQLC
jgi:hypothetical protein